MMNEENKPQIMNLGDILPFGKFSDFDIFNAFLYLYIHDRVKIRVSRCVLVILSVFVLLYCLQVVS